MMKFAVIALFTVIISGCAQPEQPLAQPTVTPQVVHSFQLTIGIVRAELSKRTVEIGGGSVSCLAFAESVSLRRGSGELLRIDQQASWSVLSSDAESSTVIFTRPGNDFNGLLWRVHWPSQVVEPLHPIC